MALRAEADSRLALTAVEWQDNLIPDWKLLRNTLLWNWAMLAAGMVHSYTQNSLLITRCAPTLHPKA